MPFRYASGFRRQIRVRMLDGEPVKVDGRLVAFDRRPD